jgi:hypothetical protein
MVRTATGQSPSRPFLTVANAPARASTVTGTEVSNLVVTRPPTSPTEVLTWAI